MLGDMSQARHLLCVLACVRVYVRVSVCLCVCVCLCLCLCLCLSVSVRVRAGPGLRDQVKTGCWYKNSQEGIAIKTGSMQKAKKQSSG